MPIQKNGEGRLSQIVEPLLSWYTENKRELPWREDASPYHVWISEIMLQQTRTTAVIPYYKRFLDELPTVSALASVSDDCLMKLWEGLGYYSRARNLKRAAKILVATHGGQLPDTVQELRALPGIGEYTAGAIASIAFGRPEPAVDGNVLRVVMRYLGCSDDVMRPATKKWVSDALRDIYPQGQRAGALTQAIMELGESICIPNGAAGCNSCPLYARCEARISERVGELPVRAPKKKRKKEERTVFLLSCQGLYAIRKRPKDGLLAGLWEFPSVPGKLSVGEAAAYIRGLDAQVLFCEPCGDAIHIFTHIEWHMTGYLVECAKPLDGFVWEPAQVVLSRYAVPTALRSFLGVMERDAEKI